MELKADYLSILSHELRNPLNSMINIIELAFKSVDDMGKLIQYLEKLKYISTFMMSINDYFFDFCKNKHIIYREEFDLNEFVEEVRALFEVQVELKQQKFEIVKNGFFAHKLIGDSLRLKQVLINLLANANKYTPPGGTIKLICDEKQIGKEALVRFIVRDNGIGMSREFIQMMFHPFTQESTKHRNFGRGLGLYIVREIVQSIGGNIEVDSEIGRGTKITVSYRLPLSKRKNNVITAADLTGVRFLVADDCDINLEVIGDMIRRQGGEVETAVDGEEALRKYLASPENYYRMVIVDIRMPKLDGIALAHKIREAKRADWELPIIATSAGYYPGDAAKRCGEINEFVNKPLSVKRFYQVIGRLLHS